MTHDQDNLPRDKSQELYLKTEALKHPSLLLPSFPVAAMFHESGGEEEFEDTFGWSAEGEERYFAEPTLSSIVTTKPSRMGERAVGGQWPLLNINRMP